MKKFLPLVLLVFIITCVMSPVVHAKRVTTATERSAMQKVIRANKPQGNVTAKVARQSYVSTVNKKWAYVQVTITIPGYPEAVWANTIMKKNTQGRWVMQDQLITWKPCSWKTKMTPRVFRDVVGASCGG